MSGRGMKKWAPFASLNEQSIYLNKMLKEREKVSKPLISNDVAMEINEILTSYHGQVVNITLFEDGEIIDIKAKISRIDVNQRAIFIENNKLEFKNILKMTSDD